MPGGAAGGGVVDSGRLVTAHRPRLPPLAQRLRSTSATAGTANHLVRVVAGKLVDPAGKCRALESLVEASPSTHGPGHHDGNGGPRVRLCPLDNPSPPHLGLPCGARPLRAPVAQKTAPTRSRLRLRKTTGVGPRFAVHVSQESEVVAQVWGRPVTEEGHAATRPTSRWRPGRSGSPRSRSGRSAPGGAEMRHSAPAPR